MELLCKKPLVGSKGNTLFYANIVYKILSKNTAGMIQVKDESGSYQWFATTGGDNPKIAKEYKDYFEIKEIT